MKNITIGFVLLVSIQVWAQSGKLGITGASRQLLIEKKALEQVSKIHNYNQLPDSARQTLLQTSVYWLMRIDSLYATDISKRVPASCLDIFTGIVHQTYNKREVNFVKGFNVAYVPRLDLLYAIYFKYYEALIKYGYDTPTVDVVMGILCQETFFLWIKGDNGQSIAPCQLHKITAAWLLQTDYMRPFFEKLFYFDGPNQTGMHHFYSLESMIEFMYVFLVKAKGYEEGSELRAIARYNGCGIHGLYVRKVRSNTIKYIAHRQMYINRNDGKGELTLEQLADSIAAVSQQAFHDNDQDFANEMKQIIHNAVYNNQITASSAHIHQQSIGYGDSKSISYQPDFDRIDIPSVGFGRPYIEKNPNIYLFAYFRENLDTTVFYHNYVAEQISGKAPQYKQSMSDADIFIYLYYTTVSPQTGNTEIHFIHNTQEYRQAARTFKIQCSRDKGKVYIIPGYPVYYYENAVNKSDTYVPSCFIETD